MVVSSPTKTFNKNLFAFGLLQPFTGRMVEMQQLLIYILSIFVDITLSSKYIMD